MAQFSDIIRFQKKQGKSAIGSLASAVGQKTLEKIDPRNYLFNRGGTLTAMFPGLKGYQAKTSDISRLSGGESGMSASQVEEISSRLEKIGGDLKIVAKNSIVLPHLARDINVVRQNITKLVKSKGIKPSLGADMFFLRAKQREDAYEAQQDKIKSKDKTSPTPVETKEQGNGFFEKIKNWLLVGAGLLAVLNFIGKLINDKEYRDKIVAAFRNLMEKLGIDTDKAVKSVLTTLAAIGGVMLAFQVASNLLVEAIKAAFLKLGKGTPSGADVPDKGKKGTPKKTPKGKGGRFGWLLPSAAVATGAVALTPSAANASMGPSTGTTPTPSPSSGSTGGGGSTTSSDSGAPVPTSPSKVNLDTSSGGSYPTYSPAMKSHGQMKNVAGAIIHHTGGESVTGAISTLKQRGLSYHYIVDKDGNVHQLLPDGAVGFHTLPGKGGLSNANTIGISLAAKDDTDVTPKQVEAAKQLNAKLAAKYGYPEKNVWGHGEVNPGHKAATEGAQVVAAIRSGTSGVVLAQNENNKGSSALNLSANVLPNPSGVVNYNVDARQYNNSITNNGGDSTTASPEDQLFKMLFMNTA